MFEAMKAALLLRNALGPYLYTSARYAYDKAVATVHPLYYDIDRPEAYVYADSQYMLGQALMAAPITHSALNRSASGGSCTPAVHYGCVDGHWSNVALLPRSFGNSDHLTIESCASMCGQLQFKVMGVSWGGIGHGSQCRCGNMIPPTSKILHNDPECTRHNCSGNQTENCGGNWRDQVYSLTHSLTHPPTHPLTHPLTHSLTHSLTHFLTLARAVTLSHFLTHLPTQPQH